MAEREQTGSACTDLDHLDAQGGGEPVTEGSAAAASPRILRGKEFSDAVMRSLILAAKDAHLVAYRTGTGVVTRRNGKMAVVAPNPAMYEDLIPPPFQENPQP